MKESCRKLYEAMLRGEEISVKTSIMRFGISSCGQRMTDLRLKYGVDVRDRWAVAPNGAQYKIYFLPPELRTQPKAKPEVTIVTAHTRRRNVIEQEPEEQISLFG